VRGVRLGLVALAILAAARVVYVFLQPGADPSFERPMLDGAYYLAWAGGAAPFNGAYYLGPLYPWFLKVTFLAASPWGIALVQQGMVVATAALAGLVARREADDVAGLCAAGFVLLYHPALFFAARPLSEPLGILLLVAALWALPARPALGGLLSGLATLARPAFLPIPLLWGAWLLLTRKRREGILVLGGAALAILPVTARNFVASGHLVPVTANSGIVAWLGNAPGAVGVYTPVDGFSGSLATQQREAMALAGTNDPVEADRFFLRKAISARLADPGGTVVLLAKRIGLTLANAEHGLDYAPDLDANPARLIAFVPFGLLLGVAVAGWRAVRTPLALALVGAAAATVLFYVSSRHRLPFATLLCIPAGVGLAASWGNALLRRENLLVVLVFGLSYLYPSQEIRRASNAAALSNLAVAEKDAGRLDAAEGTLRRAIGYDPAVAGPHYNLGVVLERLGKVDDAERAYRDALSRDPGLTEAAVNLAGILVRSNRAGEAVGPLEKALAVRSTGEGWTNLVVAQFASGNVEGARRAAGEAKQRGFEIAPGLRRMLE
jgi:tetratricopeptide (TPR) repeat protein